jgi:hypothetical protein
MLRLTLGGAALQRCDYQLALIPALAAVLAAQETFSAARNSKLKPIH